ncbi:aminotransferase class V-fold PLP-dependent enzyme [Syntrophomonas erecta]
MRRPSVKKFRKSVIGIDQRVTTRIGKSVPYVHFDNAASTPALQPVMSKLEEFLIWYSGVHRGTGHKSIICSQIYDHCHEIIADFVGADLNHNTVIMLKNTTEAINKLSYRLPLNNGALVVSTEMEHHSNDLPWRRGGKVKYVRVDEKGLLDLADLKNILRRYYPRVKLVTVCGASNVTGHINDIHLIAEMAHEYGAALLVDAAQLVPHHPVDMKPDHHPQHIDYLAFSGHKIFSPFGSGVLIGPRRTFAWGEPEYQGGGTVDLVTNHNVIWTDLPDKEEAGSPNVVGTFLLAETLKYLQKVGMSEICAYEQQLTSYALEKISSLPGITVYGSMPRVGVISFNLEEISHNQLGNLLCLEGGIGVRTGCFCAQGYVRKLMGLDEDQQSYASYLEKGLEELPGMVRISLAAYNTHREIDHLVNLLKKISSHKQYYRKLKAELPPASQWLPSNSSLRNLVV